MTTEILSKVFNTSNLSGGQKLFLKCLIVLPKVKQLYGDQVTKVDKTLATEAQTILNGDTNDN